MPACITPQLACLYAYTRAHYPHTYTHYPTTHHTTAYLLPPVAFHLDRSLLPAMPHPAFRRVPHAAFPYL